MDSFSDDEKRFVLAEMIKTSAVDINDMVVFLKSHNIVPDWEEMQVPRGRNLKQCKEAAHVLGFSVAPQLVWNQQPHSLVPTRPQPPIQQKAHHQQYNLQEQHNNSHINSQTLHPSKTESRKRKSSTDSADQPSKRTVLPSQEMHGTTRLRALKPKASENDMPFDSPPTPRQRPSAPLQNGPRKRGRPSKEEANARASLAAASAATTSTIPTEANEPTSVANAESLSKAGLAGQAGSQPRGLSGEDAEEKNIRDSSPYSERSSARP